MNHPSNKINENNYSNQRTGGNEHSLSLEMIGNQTGNNPANDAEFRGCWKNVRKKLKRKKCQASPKKNDKYESPSSEQNEIIRKNFIT